MTPPPTTTSTHRRSLLNRIRLFFRLTPRSMTFHITNCITFLTDGIVYLLGPFLICLALAIISGLTYSFFEVLLPMLGGITSLKGMIHASLVLFFLVNIIFNYAMCVCTSNADAKYQRVVRELAAASDFVYPETEEEVRSMKRDFEQKIMEKRRRIQMERQQALERMNSSNGETNGVRSRSRVRVRTGPIFGWMLLGPQEWGFCNQTNQPKPPRSHFDHITRTLVLNMDHYCPWMFNVVGYFNYRYFTNFLLYTFVAMFYGAIISYCPFRNLSNSTMIKQIKLSREQGFDTPQHLLPFVPTPDERMVVAFSFMLCLSVGISVMVLMLFHAYLIFTGQTTVEFYGNWPKRRRARARGTSWINPYDLGNLRNWQQVYGSSHPLLAILPSWREPEFLPLPIAGEKGRRHPKRDLNGESEAFLV